MPVANIVQTPSAYGYPLLIKSLLTSTLSNTPDVEIVYRDQQRYTYRQFQQRLGRLANGLSKLGLKAGDTVAVMDWDSHRYLEAYFAVPMMGAVLETINIRLSPEQILYTLNHARADVLLVHEEFLPLLSALKPKLETVKQVVLLCDGGKVPETAIPCDAEYEQLLASSPSAYAFPDFDENTRATTFYTTGTTGLPKGVYFSHRQLVLHTLAATAALSSAANGQRLHQQDVYMPITPMFHVHAWGIPYVATMLGLKQVYPGKYSPELLAGLLRKEKVTFSHCVPTILHMLLGSPACAGLDLEGWKVVIGGAALPKGLAKAALARGVDVFAGYGMSETCPVLTLAQLDAKALTLDEDGQLELRMKAGRALPLVDLQVVDEQLRASPHDGKSTGEVVVRAPWLTQGYLHDAESSERLWQGGYLHTGDIGHVDAQGYLRITDRIKDVIKSGGEWVSSVEVENVLSLHPAVSEAAVIGIPDEKWGERPLALVVLKADHVGKVEPEQLRAHVSGWVDKQLLSKWAVPQKVLFVTELERTSVGKLDKKRMRAKHGA